MPPSFFQRGGRIHLPAGKLLWLQLPNIDPLIAFRVTTHARDNAKFCEDAWLPALARCATSTWRIDPAGNYRPFDVRTGQFPPRLPDSVDGERNLV